VDYFSFEEDYHSRRVVHKKVEILGRHYLKTTMYSMLTPSNPCSHPPIILKDPGPMCLWQFFDFFFMVGAAPFQLIYSNNHMINVQTKEHFMFGSVSNNIHMLQEENEEIL
jgi:hypothetical protein